MISLGSKQYVTSQLSQGSSVMQQFVADGNYLSRASFCFVTFKRKNTGILCLTLKEVGGSVIKSISMPMSNLKDNQYHNFDMHVPVEKGHIYQFTISAKGVLHGRSVGLRWGQDTGDRPLRFVSGMSTVDGSSVACRLFYDDVQGKAMEVQKRKDIIKAISDKRKDVGITSGLISVIIPYYNTAAYIESCVRSVASQSYNFCELVIVNDGSKEPLPERRVREACPNMPVFIINHSKNKGASAARNTGFRNAIGEFLFFLDSDTTLKRETLQRCIQALHNSKAHFAYGDFQWGPNTIHGQPWSFTKLKEKNYVSTMALVRRNVFPGFDENLARHQDWDLWLTLGGKGCSGAYVGRQLLFETPVRSGSISSGGSIGIKQSKKIIKQKHGI